MEITRVQQWVGATLLLGIAGLGMVTPMAYVSTLMIERDGLHDRAIGIWVMSMILGLATMQAAWALLGHRTVSPWLPVGLIPAVVAAFWLF